MTHPRVVRVVACIVMVCGATAVSVTSAAANDTSIKAAIRSYNPRMLVDEGHLVTALGEYKTSRDPKGVQAALATCIATFHALRSKIAAQSASRHSVRAGRAKLETGLQAIIVAYEGLNTAFGERKMSPEAAKTEAANATIAVDKGRTDLAEGMKLLR